MHRLPRYHQYAQKPPEDFERRFVGTTDLARDGPWDFVVVGAGSAGCMLASKLAQHPGVRVLLVEAISYNIIVHYTIIDSINYYIL